MADKKAGLDCRLLLEKGLLSPFNIGMTQEPMAAYHEAEYLWTVPTRLLNQIRSAR